MVSSYDTTEYEKNGMFVVEQNDSLSFMDLSTMEEAPFATTLPASTKAEPVTPLAKAITRFYIMISCITSRTPIFTVSATNIPLILSSGSAA